MTGGRPPSRRIFVCGQTGTGKSTWIRQQVIRTEPRLLVFDHMAEYLEEPGLERLQARDLVPWLARHRSGIARCVIVPAGNAGQVFPFVCRLPMAFPEITIVCDELDTFAGAIRPPTPPEFQRVIHFGRHFGCSFVGASRRPADVSRAFTSQARRFICFRTTEPADVKFLRSVIGPAADQVPELPDLTFIDWHGGQVIRGTVDPTR